MPLFLVWFALHPDYHEFRIQEFESLCGIYGVERSSIWDVELPTYVSWYEDRYSRPLDNDHSNSFVWVNLPSEEIAREILKRSVLTRGFLQVWSSSSSHEETKRILRSNYEVRDKYLNRYIFDEDLEFCWKVKSIGKKLTREEQVGRMNEYGFLFKGTEKVNINSPDLVLGIFEDWRGIEMSNLKISKKETSRIKPELRRVYVGRVVGVQGSALNDSKDEKSLWWLKYSLNRRPVLGPTTMDNELAFIMCNVAQIKENDVVLDPFCGTGGILISASHLGAICFGSDFDLRVINGWFCSYVNPHMIKDASIDKNISKSIFTNFEHYHLRSPDVIRMDISKPSVRGSWVDAIVCDPPYGIRATSRTTNVYGSKSREICVNRYMDEFNYRRNRNNSIMDVSDCFNRNSFGVLQSIDDMIYDLLDFSSKNLVDGGRLVFLLPLLVSESNFIVSALLENSKPAFEVDTPFMQVLGGGLGRLLICMTLVDRKSFRNKRRNENRWIAI
ncbi:hypothetical protein FG386_000215 [Cryptosporidium ryanae]|uniref:uncharacterized protein n=1 Tax=Cryptosporidium ryanae TaxID=515981 RepID=UPI00351A6ED0|nr:hypothetical protein FG386_000215 [Cryptosporidium ryanae]